MSENLGAPMTGIGCDNLVGSHKWSARESGNLDEYKKGVEKYDKHEAAQRGMPGSDLHKIA